MAEGICKLTGRAGKFVRSHLIPQAFTRPIGKEGFICGGEGTVPKKGWTSWYDERLVTNEGEKILASYDNWAVRELRRLELVWSGWESKANLPIEYCYKSGNRLVRQLECSDPGKLRLFFLSLLWRVAATALPEFHTIVLPEDDLARLRIMLLNREASPLDFYPTSLLQMITRGPSHNLGPIPTNFGKGRNQFRTFRFYFDGLIAHIHRDVVPETLGTHCVGASTILHVQTQTWEDSFQFSNMKQHIIEGTLQWPEIIGKLTRSGRNSGKV